MARGPFPQTRPWSRSPSSAVECTWRRGTLFVPALGPLADEPPEPMTRSDYERVKTRVHASWNGDLVIDKADVEMLLAEIRWLKRRLRRVEHVIQPLAEALGLPEANPKT
jgi:hypothetical protein